MIITEEKLLEVIPKDTLEASKYKIGGKTKIRLFNTNEELSTYPALYPNTSKYRDAFKEVENITGLLVDTKDGQPTGNRKTELIIDYVKIEDRPLPEGLSNELY